MELINSKREEKTPELMPEIELEISSALESLLQKELLEHPDEDVFAIAELNRFSEAVIKNEEEFAQDNSFSLAEYLKSNDAQPIFNYDYSSDEPRSFYDPINVQEIKIKEEITEEIKAKKIANTWNVHRAENGDPSLAKKAAQELYKTINFTMNTILYDLAEA